MVLWAVLNGLALSGALMIGVWILLDLPTCNGDTVRIFNYDVTKRDRISELEKKLEEREEKTTRISVDLLDRDNFTKLQGIHDEMQPIVNQILMSEVPMIKVIAYLLLQYHNEFFDNWLSRYKIPHGKEGVLAHCRNILLAENRRRK